MEKIKFEWPAPITRNHVVESYINNELTERDQRTAQQVAEQITNPDLPLASCQVLIPVAAHQESSQIANAMAQYAKQETDTPFSVILSLNSPSSQQENPHILETIAEVEAAKLRHPNLDLRHALTFYDAPKIGMIRRDLWNAALLTSTAEGAYSGDGDDVIGVNHDVDLVSLSPRYIQRIQKHYEHRENKYNKNNLKLMRHSPSSTVLRHALSPEHPNISKGIAWEDYWNRSRNAGYEAGLVSPFSHYASSGGFSADAITYETRPLFGESVDTPFYHRIPGTVAETSPRRYIDRLHHGFAAIWSNETFGDSDDCRDTTARRPDITFAELETLLLDGDRLEDSITSVAHHALDVHVRKLNTDYRRVSDDGSEASREETIKIYAGLVDVAFRSMLTVGTVADRLIQSTDVTRRIDAFVFNPDTTHGIAYDRLYFKK